MSVQYPSLSVYMEIILWSLSGIWQKQLFRG